MNNFAKHKINVDYIGYITTSNGVAIYKEWAIDDHSCIVDKLKEWVNLCTVSVPIMRALYKDLFPPKFWPKGYCLDNEYGDVVYNVITNPLDVLNQYNIEHQERLHEINKQYRKFKQN